MLVFFLVFFKALLIEAHSMPFQVQPSTMANVVKGLYSLRPGELFRLQYFYRHTEATGVVS